MSEETSILNNYDQGGPLASMTSDYIYCSSNEAEDIIVDADDYQSINHHCPSVSDNTESNNIEQVAHMSDDEISGEIDREYTGQFEGPEKTLEVDFRRVDGVQTSSFPANIKTGLRTLARTDLDAICKRARCTILSSVSNQYLDAYVLSESSLFVYNYMIVIKTCGTTTLLRCLAVLIELGKRLDLELDWVGYSRKNFNFPEDQCFPHGSFTQELDYLYSHRNLCNKLDGNGYTLGPITDDHWFVFIADKTLRSTPDLDNDRVLNIMMFDIDIEMADLFYYHKYQAKLNDEETDEEAVKRISFEQTKAAGIDALCPGAMFDPRAFEPCGYSMNAILYKSYCTMHITPEEGSSYASFETNQKLASYTALINNVVRTFKPKKFVMTLMADEGGVNEIAKGGCPLIGKAADSQIIVPSKIADGNKKNIVFKRSNLASITAENDCCCLMGNWTVEQDPIEENIRRSRGLTFT
mmetsp:Transcript_15854/g.18421  ORF Transcript_15854/g.18421 Transcript_15854/m.18421 type:complete len:468 (-) Transcript_15854:134-1537(-)